jgi:hypothetical protein
MRKFACLHLFFAAGCAQSTVSGVTLDEYGERFATAYCDMLRDCYGTDIYEAVLGTDCAGTFLRGWDEGAQPRIEEAIAAGTVSYDESSAAECLAIVESIGCEAIDRPSLPACDAVLVGTVAAGGACSLDEECAGESYCRLDASCPGTCQARVASGSACTGDAACQANLRCGTDGTCQAPAAMGAACGGSSGVECSGGTFCFGAAMGSAGTCRSPLSLQTAALGATCQPGGGMGPLCQPGLSCALTGIAGMMPTFACEAASPSGGACHVAIPDSCPSGEHCAGIDLMMFDFDGTCAPLPGDGEACAAVPFGAQCAAGTRCAAGTCRAIGSIGAACTDAGDCWSGTCDGGTCAAGALCG